MGNFEKMSHLQLLALVARMEQAMGRHLAIQEALGEQLVQKKAEIDMLSSLLLAVVRRGASGTRGGHNWVEIGQEELAEAQELGTLELTAPNRERDTYLLRATMRPQEPAPKPKLEAVADEHHHTPNEPTCDKDANCVLGPGHEGDCAVPPAEPKLLS